MAERVSGDSNKILEQKSTVHLLLENIIMSVLGGRRDQRWGTSLTPLPGGG